MCGRGKGSLGVSVEIGVVDTHFPLTGFLGYKHRVGEPNWVFTFTDELDS
jgi:hypothetical protein